MGVVELVVAMGSFDKAVGIMCFPEPDVESESVLVEWLVLLVPDQFVGFESVVCVRLDRKVWGHALL